MNVCVFLYRGDSTSKQVDLGVIVVKCSSDFDQVGGASLPLPSSVVLASGSQKQNIVTCSGFLEPGHYASCHYLSASVTTPLLSCPHLVPTWWHCIRVVKCRTSPTLPPDQASSPRQCSSWHATVVVAG